MRKSAEERFWDKVEKTETCWNWMGAPMSTGYGRFKDSAGKTTLAHRTSYAIENGEIPAGLHVDHICHNRHCVNPDHLRLTTRVQNAENRAGATKHNKSSGIRGVSWNIGVKKWIVTAGHEGNKYYGGIYDDIEEAEQAAIALRNRLHTHNYIDRLAS